METLLSEEMHKERLDLSYNVVSKDRSHFILKLKNLLMMIKD